MYKNYKMAKVKKKKNQNNVNNGTFILTKRIAKHGSQAIIVIPRILQEELKPQTIVQLKIDVLKEAGVEK